MKQTPSKSSVAATLDIWTLAAVRAEIQARAADSRQAWKMNPREIDHVDGRLTRSAALEGVAIWIDEQILIVDADMDRRWELTEAGRQAIATIEQAQQLHLQAAS